MSKIHVSELDMRQWMTAQQAAELLGVRYSTSLQILKDAGIEPIYVVGVASGGVGFYWRAAVRKIAREREQVRQVPEGYVTAEEVSKMLGVKRRSIYDMIRGGKLSARLIQGRAGLRYICPREHVEQVLAERKRMEERRQAAAAPPKTVTPATEQELRLIALCCRKAGLSVLEYSALCMIEKAGDWVPMPRIVEWLGTTQSSASQTVSSWVLPLDAVEKMRSPQDERTVWVRITEAGKARLARIRGKG